MDLVGSVRHGRIVQIVLGSLIVGGLVLRAAFGFSADYIGAEKCGACHPAEYQQWQSTGHAVSLARLSKVQQKDATCRACHTMAPASEDPGLASVQCEACHGAGRYYAPRYVMKDPELAKMLNLQPITEDQCAPCHAKDTPSIREFNYQERLALVVHKPAKIDTQVKHVHQKQP